MGVYDEANMLVFESQSFENVGVVLGLKHVFGDRVLGGTTS